MSYASCWQAVNHRLMARALAECTYEGLLTAEPITEKQYQIISDGPVYRFNARRTPWDYLCIESNSIVRDEYPATDAVQLILDCRKQLGINDITLGQFVEELNNTLAGDLIRQQTLASLDAPAMVDLPPEELEGLLDGHPKVVANRGRIGWGSHDLATYSPEARMPFQVRWLALHRASGVRCYGAPAPEQCLADEDQHRLADYLASADWHLLPVHPWQWQRYIQSQYATLLHAGTLVDLGECGHRYLPQQSIRTLSNSVHPGQCDLKLALSILNTSCYRGIPSQAMALAPELSRWLASVAASDPYLAQSGLRVQKELGGVYLPQPHQQQIAGTPYRYPEMAGAVWRESLASKTGPGERGWIFAVLMQTDARGMPLVSEIIQRSGVSAEQWLTRLFDRVTLPLYHLLCGYGVGLVAHGQNLGVIFRHYLPERVVIKDFHGDLRLVDSELPEQAGVPEPIINALSRLPARHLVHDLYTGHLVTGLRFLSPLLEASTGFPETRFYQLLRERILRYQAAHPGLQPQFAQFDLLRPEMERVCLNKVRFQIGYADDAERPRPALGPRLPNPLHTQTNACLTHGVLS